VDCRALADLPWHASLGMDRVMPVKVDFEVSSGNVFADIGVAEPDEALVKAKIVEQIAHVLSTTKLNQTQAARLLRIDQPKVSALLRGRLGGFSLGRLLRYLTMLGKDVEIVIHNRAAGPGEVRVRSA
jgi:predicted XRE-type DNA-binding protein